LRNFPVEVGPVALPMLNYLLTSGEDRFKLVGVVTQPDRPSGRGKKLRPNPVAKWAEDSGVEVIKPEKPGEQEIQWLADCDAELVIVMAYGHLLSRKMLAAPRLGMVNIHASILPAYRGASPIQAAILSQEEETGVTLMKIIPKMDAGPILDIERVRINSEDTGGAMYNKLSQATVSLIQRNLDVLLSGNAVFKEQVDEDASYTRKLLKSDGVLDFSSSASELAARIQAFDPWPGCLMLHDSRRLKVSHAYSIDKAHQYEPGTLVTCTDQVIEIATGEGMLAIAYLQRAGGRMLKIGEFLRGYVLEEGTVFKSQAMSSIVSRK